MKVKGNYFEIERNMNDSIVSKRPEIMIYQY